MEIAELTAKRSACIKRKVGCILLNKQGHILATGYNGPASGLEHCDEIGCLREFSKSGMQLELCRAVHAEQNALLQCSDIQKIETAVITTAPCLTCVKLLLNTSCQNIFFKEDYANEWGKNYWAAAGRKMLQIQ